MSALCVAADPLYDEHRRDSEQELAVAAANASSVDDANLVGAVRVALRHGVSPDRVRFLVQLANPILGDDPHLFGSSHHDEYLRLQQPPLKYGGLEDFVVAVDALRAYVDTTELHIDHALEMAGGIAHRAGISFADGCAIAVMRLVRPGTGRSPVDDEYRLDLAGDMFAAGYEK